MGSERSHVVTGSGRGIGRAIVERLLADGDAVTTIAVDGGRTVVTHDPQPPS